MVLRAQHAGGEPPWAYDQSIFKFGYNPDIDLGTFPEEVWSPGGLITWPTAQAQAQVEAVDINDDAAGTGARTIALQGVNDQFDYVLETGLALNGGGTVNSVNNFLFVDRAFVETHGADPSQTNIGNIIIRIGGNIVAQIDAGSGQTLQAVYTVPNSLAPNTDAYLLAAFASIGRVPAEFVRLRVMIQDQSAGIGVGGVRSSGDIHFHSHGASFIGYEFRTPRRLPPGMRIWFRVMEVSANNIAVSAAFEIAWF